MTRQKKPFSRRLREAALILVLLPIALPIALIALALYFPHKLALYMLVWALWLSKGRDALVVYSESPILARIHDDADLVRWLRSVPLF